MRSPHCRAQNNVLKMCAPPNRQQGVLARTQGWLHHDLPSCQEIIHRQMSSQAQEAPKAENWSHSSPLGDEQHYLSTSLGPPWSQPSARSLHTTHTPNPHRGNVCHWGVRAGGAPISLVSRPWIYMEKTLQVETDRDILVHQGVHHRNQEADA